MKEKLKRVMAGALIVCIALGVPVDMCKVTAAASARGIVLFPGGGDTEEDSMEEEVLEEDVFEEDKLAEDPSEEGNSKDRLTGGLQLITVWEGMPEYISEDISEFILEELSNRETDEESLSANCKGNTFDIDLTGMDAQFLLEITDEGEFDYRKYIDSENSPELIIKLIPSARFENWIEKEYMDNDQEYLEGGRYAIELENTDVVSLDGEQKQENTGREKTSIYMTSKDRVELIVNGVGETFYEVRTTEDSEHKAQPITKLIKVNNSTLYDDDFYITVSGDNKKYHFEEWQAYLKSCNGWVNKDIEIMLSDYGKKYFSAIKTEENCGEKSGKKSYKFWAENPDRNASTKEVENGARTFVAGIDKEAPTCGRLFSDSKCYEPTKTDTEQYFAEDFVLKGSLLDTGSGVSRVEYTTDYTDKENAVWVTATTQAEPETDNLDFCITLSDGCYEAIAVRGYDHAGNISEVKSFVNDKGAFIKIIVDKSEPVINIKGMSDGQPYNGDNDNWTNKNVTFDLAVEKGSCAYAGIYKCEYAYDKIGDAVNSKNMTGLSEEWSGLPLQDEVSAALEIDKDRNGYYYFRAVSKAGVPSREIVKKRILLQHQAADIKPMIVNDVDETKRKNDWYNKESGVPLIQFEYPDYDTGDMSKEYDAPVTVNYRLTVKAGNTIELPQGEENTTNNMTIEKKAVIGILNSEDVSEDADGVRKFILKKDDLDKCSIDFGFDRTTKEAQDGIYTLEYWTTDKAGNASEKQTQIYKIDSHEPTDLTVTLENSEFPVGKESTIMYEEFYQDNVSGNVTAQYGISGKGSLAVLQAKKIGEWRDMNGANLNAVNDTGVINISPNTRCFLYVRAEDNAGNVAEGWTRGIVVDNMAPNQESKKELIIEPVGANKHGFFNGDVKVEIDIKDAPEDDNCAALMYVNGTVGKDGKDTITDKELFSFTKELPTDDELTDASRFTSFQVVNAKENESNEAYIEVTVVDRSGNTKTSTQMLKIDVTKPQIEIAFDSNDAANGRFYNEVRTATIRVQELNFDSSAVDISVTKDGQAYDYNLSDWTSDESTHYATIAFSEDGEYTMEVSCTDLADNESDKAKTETFIIDRTAPVMTMAFDSKQDKVFHENYFNAAVTAVITVTEHNFREDDFAMNIVPAVSKKGMWSHDGDVHTLRLAFDGDNAYHITCAYTDLAGNAVDSNDSANTVEQDFVIDTLAPIIFIEGVTDGSANRGPVLPVISVLDFNMEMQETVISVTTGVGDVVENTIEAATIDDENGIGYRFTLVDMTDQEDNVYYLTVSACDKAGNESALTYRFSLNRRGSAYDLAQIMDLMDRQYINYAGFSDIQIVEMNLDKVEDFEIYASRNGALGYSAVYSKEIKGSVDTGYTYIYHVNRENFAEEGTYRLSLYSKDRAGNEVNNTTDIHGNEISFIIDNTPPKVVFDGIETGMVYDVESQEVHVSVTDNFKLSEAELMLVNKANDVIDRWDYMELADENGQMDLVIPQYNGELSLLYRVKDAAGNEMQTFQGEQAALCDFLVTTDKFVQFINKPSKTPFGRIILFMGAAGFIVLVTAISLHKRRCNRCAEV